MENEKKNIPNIKDERPWYKKKRYIGTGLIAVFLVILGSGGNSSNQVVNPEIQTIPTYNSYNTQPHQFTAPSVVAPKTTPSNNTSSLSNDNYYTNTYGNSVHSPAYSNSVPAGASARCGDGTYSFSQNRRGTCSRHGGVNEWL